MQAVKVGVSRFSVDDPYYLVLSMRWPTFLVSVLSMFLVTNLVFAVLFWLMPGSIANARPGDFSDAFFFSVETLATVGYGVMTPATAYGHGIATAEIFQRHGGHHALRGWPRPDGARGQPAAAGDQRDQCADKLPA